MINRKEQSKAMYSDNVTLKKLVIQSKTDNSSGVPDYYYSFKVVLYFLIVEFEINYKPVFIVLHL